MNVDKFDTNPLLVNVNKLKPYWHSELTPNGLESQIEGGRDANIRVIQQGNEKMNESTTRSYLDLELV